MQKNRRKVPLLRSLALSLLDSDLRRAQTIELIDEALPLMAADVENELHEQEAKVFYEIFSEHFEPKIRIILRLKKMEHEYIILLNSKNSMFILGSEIGGQFADTADQVVDLLKTSLMKLKPSFK